MLDFYRWFSKSPNYIRRFGVFHGLRLLFRIERNLPNKSNLIVKYMLPNYHFPIYLRNNVGDHATFWQCLVRNQYDFYRFPQSRRLLALYDKNVEKRSKVLIIDCGAHIGLATIWFSRQFPESVIYAVEPDDENYELLKMNTAHIGERVKTLKGAILDEHKNVEIVNPESGTAAFRIGEAVGEAKRPVTTYTINEICGFAGFENPFIVKIDIEGSQSHLFKSNTEWVENTHLITLELDDWLKPWQGTSRSFFSCISHYPFDYLLGEESIFCFRDFEEDLSRSWSVNHNSIAT